tara:strand:+ start:181 stop:816 length:636 start_codon:yes stop_codon:yes gene_type:complete
MFLSDKNILFLHPPRNGGKSIEDCVFDIKPKLGSSDHRNVQEWIDRGELKKDNLSQYYTFMFCRNPWDRVVSLYHGMAQLYGNKLGSFDEYVEKKSFNNGHKPQLHYITITEPKNINEKFIDTFNKRTILKLNFIGRFEKYNEEYDSLCEDIKKHKDIDLKPLPHHHKSEHKPYWEYYNEKTKNIVAEVWKDDIEYFGYEFMGHNNKKLDL